MIKDEQDSVIYNHEVHGASASAPTRTPLVLFALPALPTSYLPAIADAV